GPATHIWGYGSSPVIHDGKVFLNFGPGKRQFLVALGLKDGKEIWTFDEPGGNDTRAGRMAGSWSTPNIVKVDGKDQLLCSMPTRVVALNPADGKLIWEIKGLNGPNGDLLYTSLVFNGNIGIAMAGYTGPIVAFKLGGKGDMTEANTLWTSKGKQPQRIGAGIIVEDHVYIANADSGTAHCYELKTGKHTEVEIPEFVPYATWIEQIDAERRAMLKRFTDIRGLTEEQRSQAAQAFERRVRQLADYLAGESLDIQAYQHELWRLENLREIAGTKEVPYQQRRVAQKLAETDRTPLKWVAMVRQYDQEFANELHGLLTEEQSASTVGGQALAALTDPKQTQLRWMNLAVTGLTIGVGCCLLLGLFTRLASVAGALFLLSVMATQPPWVAGANTMFFYYQLVEFAAFVFLAAVSAGRVAGLDFILHGLWSMCCGRKVA
ncbi:MAG: PQQ-binding-like beta-propeller repeat protein, partial [Planctomycetes bacterium]|nr:PQQ-binding-like beta-propeller repeat protein [Planctomycetota bacterium]